VTFPTPATHPRTCTACHGSGWQDAPPVIEIVNGEPHPYTTLAPCTHIWWDDEPDLELPDLWNPDA
jgi:hypothetical protein